MDRSELLALAWLGNDWHAGPDMPDHVLDVITPMREAGLVERKFGDMGPVETSERIDGFDVHIGACWWFRITDKGRAFAAQQPSGAMTGE